VDVQRPVEPCAARAAAPARVAQRGHVEPSVRIFDAGQRLADEDQVRAGRGQSEQGLGQWGDRQAADDRARIGGPAPTDEQAGR
jgi:hypothetical protein